ncbi:MAG: HU family DNA-binding protein [Gemmataceae bacterium]
MAKAKAKALTKSALYAQLAEKTNLKKSEVQSVLDTLLEAIHEQLGNKGPGILTLPGVARFKVRKVKAVKGGVKKVNPLNGQEYVTKDKPAYNKITILPVKSLKESLK